MIDGVEHSRVPLDEPPPDYFTEPGAQTRDLSLRSTSLHIVSSDSSLVDFRSSRMLSASLNGSPVRRAVPAIGQVSTRLPSTRTNISGDAPTSCSSPNCRKNSYGLGLAICMRSNNSEGLCAY